MNKVHFIFYILIAFSCNNNDSDPQPDIQDFQPIKMEDVDGSRELIYDEVTGKVKAVEVVTKFVDGTKAENVQTLVYNSEGKLLEINTDYGSRVVYTYDDHGKVSSAEEYSNGFWSQRHEYAYNQIGLLKESITYRDVAQEGGLIPVAKEAFSYDSNNNLILQTLYHYTELGSEAKVSTTTFSNYDKKINTESYFAISPFNPLAKVKQNNPGKMVITNGSDIITMVETYTYKYNFAGYATEKTSHVTMYNGNSGSFTTTYTFK